MTSLPPTTDPEAYTRASVTDYLRAAEAERQRLQQAIVDARRRTVMARRRAARPGVPVPIPSLTVSDAGPVRVGTVWSELDRSGEPEWAGHAPSDRRSSYLTGRTPLAARELEAEPSAGADRVTGHHRGMRPSTPVSPARGAVTTRG
jgi:hypothetical protein